MSAYTALPDSTLAFVAKQLEQRLASVDPSASMIASALHADYTARLTAVREEQARRAGSNVTEPGRPVRRRR